MHISKFIAGSFLLLFSFTSFSQNFVRDKFNFNSDWKFKTGNNQGAEKIAFNDKNWTPVTLPHAYNQEEAFKVSIEKLSTGIVWYRKNFKIPKELEGKKVFIEFEGIRQGGEIYLNGKKVGLHENGTMAFGLDLSKHLNFGKEENVLALRIDNSWDYREKSTNATYRWNNINFNANYGGIPKNVILHITNSVYQTLPLYSNLETTGVYIYAKDIKILNKQAIVHAESEVRNESDLDQDLTYNVIVEDLEGKEVAQFSSEEQTIKAGETKILASEQLVEELNFWSWGYGYLYTIKTQLIRNENIIDEVSTKTGFRKTAFQNGMVFLNDRVLQMKGYAQRTSNEWPALGLSVPPWMSDFSNHLMVKSNANLVRWMHTTPWKQDVESCDRVGLLQAMPAGDAEGDTKGDHWNQRKRLMRDAIIYNRNNPSIVFYECGNDAISESHMYEMKSIRNTFDPHGGRAIGSREMLDSREAEYGGEMLYINKSADIPLWATEYSRDEGLRKYWDEFTPPYHREGDGPLYKGQKATSYNHNQDAHAIENVVRWSDYFEARPGTGKRVSSGGVNIIFSDSNTHHRGEEIYRSSGEVDPMRIPKDNYYAHQVMWNGWVDIEKDSSHILGHWNYEKDIVKDIYVVSTGEKVELFLNEKSLGFGEKSNHFLFTFKDVKFESGTLKAISYDIDSIIVSEVNKITVGEPESIRLKLHTAPKGLTADGADIALIDVEVVDAEGRRCPIDTSEINFSLSGPSTWIGGIADGADNHIQSKNLPVINGINRVMIKSSIKPGTIRLNATSTGLKSDELKLNSIDFDSKEGLSTEFPASQLSSNLERGPTPETPSYSVKRKPIYITHSQAGSHHDDLYKSYDDNELTEWTNDGKIKNGWIEYGFIEPTIVNQCIIKLSGWRTKTYPIRIWAGDEKLFEGETWQSLGYITIPFEAVKTDKIRIELIGNNQEEDAYHEITEVEPTKNLDMYDDEKAANAKGQLRIVEIEFYEK